MPGRRIFIDRGLRTCFINVNNHSSGEVGYWATIYLLASYTKYFYFFTSLLGYWITKKMNYLKNPGNWAKINKIIWYNTTEIWSLSYWLVTWKCRICGNRTQRLKLITLYTIKHALSRAYLSVRICNSNDINKFNSI